jgi:hypothetical protein
MKWESPPPGSNRYTKNAYEDEAKELRDHPGEWGVVVEFPLERNGDKAKKDNNEGRRVANQIRTGKYLKFRPKGSFEAVSRIVKSSDGEIIRVHARYVPEEERTDE